MKITEIKEINELLTKALQQECSLVDEHKSFYRLEFPGISSISDQEFQDNCEDFLSQFDIKIGATKILYPQEGCKVFTLQIDKLPLDQFLETLAAISENSQFHESLEPDKILLVNELLDNGVNINSKNIFGDTPLHIAVQKKYDVIASLLIERGALILPNNKNETVLQIIDQQQDDLLGKRLIDAVLNSDSKISKPPFKHQELSTYWDEQLIKRTLQHDHQKVDNIIKFFSSKEFNITNKAEQSVVINLGN